MLSVDPRERLKLAVLFLAPIGLVLATGFLMSPRSVVADAGAQPIPVIGYAPQMPKTEWSPEETAIAEYITVLEQEPFESSPMYYRARPSNGPVEVEPVTGGELSVAAIMDSSDGARALINGRLCAVGDHLDERRWVITEINAAERLVQMRNTETMEHRVLKVGR